MEKNEAQRELTRSLMGSPFRFYCPAGETREVVVVDDAPDFFRHEHNLQNHRSKKWDIYVACINDRANCPVCKDTDRAAYFGMYLTIIDLTGYENKDGVEVEWSKKLLVVKQTQQKKIMRLYERHGTLRGMVLQMTRDGEKDAAIGNDIEFVEFMSEDDLATYETEYEDQNGKVHQVIGNEPFNYDEIFPEPTEQQLRAIVGGKPEAGSRDDDDRELGRGRRGRGDDDDGFRDGERDRGTARSRPARGAREEPEERTTTRRAATRGREREEPVEQEQEAEQDDRRSSRAAPERGERSRPAARTARAEREQPEDPPQRQRAAATRRAPVRDEQDDAPPARAPAQSMAERRRALRR